MAENNNNIEIPENADKILFAEDLIRYVMRRNARVEYAGWRAVPHRELIYNGFNETAKLAVTFLDSTMEMDHDEIYHSMRNLNVVNYDTFKRLANDMGLQYFPAGFDANNFLHFCVHVASLAAYFYLNGVLEAPDLAVVYIVKPIEDIDMTTGGWDTLNSSAQRYATMARDSMNKLSPESVNSDEEDVVEDDIASEGDRGAPEANYLGEVPGEANRHDAQNYTNCSNEKKRRHTK